MAVNQCVGLRKINLGRGSIVKGLVKTFVVVKVKIGGNIPYFPPPLLLLSRYIPKLQTGTSKRITSNTSPNLPSG